MSNDTEQKFESRDPSSVEEEERCANMSLREIYADLLIGELPRCPECSKILQDRCISECDYCGFSFSYLEKILPVDGLPELRSVMDFSDMLSPESIALIEKQQQAICKTYPQFNLKVCLLPLQKGIKIQEMGLWMLNYCPIAEHEYEVDKMWTIYLLIDTLTKKCSITSGYQAEVFFSDDEAWKLVSLLNSRMRKGDYADAICSYYDELADVLDRSKYQDRMQFKRFKKNRK